MTIAAACPVSAGACARRAGKPPLPGCCRRADLEEGDR